MLNCLKPIYVRQKCLIESGPLDERTMENRFLGECLREDCIAEDALRRCGERVRGKTKPRGRHSSLQAVQWPRGQTHLFQNAETNPTVNLFAFSSMS